MYLALLPLEKPVIVKYRKPVTIFVTGIVIRYYWVPLMPVVLQGKSGYICRVSSAEAMMNCP